MPHNMAVLTDAAPAASLHLPLSLPRGKPPGYAL